jgi:predicted metal-dependent hydrolase
MSVFEIDDLVFDLRRSERRKTVGITIERDGSLVVTAPTGLAQHEIERIAARKRGWIYTRLAEREQLGPGPLRKEFVAGESLAYLGRRYRLFWSEDADGPPLSLASNRFLLRRGEGGHGMELFRRFYSERGLEWLPRRIERVADRIGVAPGELSVRELGYRWGSCSSRGLNFHWRIMQLPPRIIEYVIAHELVHLIEPHHGPAFWKRLERAMPDYRRRKGWLVEHGREF